MTVNVYEQSIIIFSAALTVVWTAFNCQFSPIRALSCVANLVANTATIMIAILAVNTLYSQTDSDVDAMGIYTDFQVGNRSTIFNNWTVNGTVNDLYEKLNLDNYEYFCDSIDQNLQITNQGVNNKNWKTSRDNFKAKLLLRRILKDHYFQTNLDGSRCLTINLAPIIPSFEKIKQKVCFTPFGLEIFQNQNLNNGSNIDSIKKQIRQIVQEENTLSYFEDDNVLKFWGKLAVNFYETLLRNLKTFEINQKMEFNIEEKGKKVLSISLFQEG